MTYLHFVWLGSKRAQKNGVAEKGWRLDMAVRAGLPVPHGGILLDDFYWLAVEEGVVVVEEGHLHIPAPLALHDLLYTAVRFPKLEKPCAVRPLFAPAVTSVPPCLNIPITDAASLAAALGTLWTAAVAAGEDARHDILIQEMVAVKAAGTAVTSSDGGHDIVTMGDDSYPLPPLGLWQRPESKAPPHTQRLQKLLRGLRRTFGQGGWQVAWADDGRVCWLLQLQAVVHD